MDYGFAAIQMDYSKIILQVSINFSCKLVTLAMKIKKTQNSNVTCKTSISHQIHAQRLPIMLEKQKFPLLSQWTFSLVDF